MKYIPKAIESPTVLKKKSRVITGGLNCGKLLGHQHRPDQQLNLQSLCQEDCSFLHRKAFSICPLLSFCCSAKKRILLYNITLKITFNIDSRVSSTVIGQSLQIGSDSVVKLFTVNNYWYQLVKYCGKKNAG